MSDGAVLAALRARFLERHAWVVVSAELTVISYSTEWQDRFGKVIDRPEVGAPLSDFFDEFIGLTSYISAIMRSRLPEFRLERVNRVDDTGAVHYFDFMLQPIHETTHLLLTIESADEFGQLEQMLVQERNELRLARAELSKANETLRQLDRFKALFFSMAAHDLRAPLMTVRGYADLIEMMVQQDRSFAYAETAAEYTTTIKAQVDWLDRLIQTILDLNRIETDKFELSRELCNLNDVVRHAVDAQQPLALLNDQQLSVDLTQSGLLITVDPGRIEQCVHNLIANAVKYTGPNGQIEASVVDLADSAEITIRDNGRGIAAEELPHVFDLYYRTEGAKLGQASGTGLGLYVVRSIVEMHGGTIEVASELGIGTTFTIRLPKGPLPA